MKKMGKKKMRKTNLKTKTMKNPKNERISYQVAITMLRSKLLLTKNRTAIKTNNLTLKKKTGFVSQKV